jgi:hypothetical protein
MLSTVVAPTCGGWVGSRGEARALPKKQNNNNSRRTPSQAGRGSGQCPMKQPAKRGLLLANQRHMDVAESLWLLLSHKPLLASSTSSPGTLQSQNGAYPRLLSGS